MAETKLLSYVNGGYLDFALNLNISVNWICRVW